MQLTFSSTSGPQLTCTEYWSLENLGKILIFYLQDIKTESYKMCHPYQLIISMLCANTPNTLRKSNYFIFQNKNVEGLRS